MNSLNTDFQTTSKILLRRFEVSYRIIGSQGTAIASGDLYNTVRVMVYKTPLRTGTTPTQPLVDVVSFPKLLDVEKVLMDEKFALPAQAFDSSDYNVPLVRTGHRVIPVNKTLEFYTDDIPSTTSWYSRNGNVWFACVSDSSVSPNPEISMKFRFYYELKPANY